MTEEKEIPKETPDDACGVDEPLEGEGANGGDDDFGDEWNFLGDPELKDEFGKSEEPPEDYDGGFDRLPGGNYVCRVDKLYPAESQTGRNMLKWELIVVGDQHGGKYAGRKVFRQNMLETAQNLTFLRRDLAIFQIRLDGLGDLPLRIGEVPGSRVNVNIKWKEGADFPEVYLGKLVALASDDGYGGAASADLDAEMADQAEKVF